MKGHDWCIIKLGVPGFINVIDVNTCYFTGNYSPKVSVQGIYLQETPVSSRINSQCKLDNN